MHVEKLLPTMEELGSLAKPYRHSSRHAAVEKHQEQCGCKYPITVTKSAPDSDSSLFGARQPVKTEVLILFCTRRRKPYYSSALTCPPESRMFTDVHKSFP